MVAFCAQAEIPVHMLNCHGGNHVPLTACLELIQYALDDLAKVSLACIASFGGCQIRQDFHYYGVFIYGFYQFKECLGVFFLITLNTPYYNYILYLKISQDDFCSSNLHTSINSSFEIAPSFIYRRAVEGTNIP